MNLNCQNCVATLSEYLCDVPSEWREKIVKVICDGLQSESSAACEDLVACQTVTKLSAFEKSTDSISISYTDEKGKKFKRSFSFVDLLNTAANEVDPKCVASQDDWNSWTLQEKLNAVIEKDCDCCHNGTTTTTTTTIPSVPEESIFTVVDSSGDPLPFTVSLYDQVTNIPYIINSIAGGEVSNAYTGTDNLSKIIISHAPDVSVNVTVIADGVIINTLDQYTGTVVVSNIPAKADIIVSLASGVATTSTTSTTTDTTGEPVEETTSSTTTITTPSPEISLTTTTTVPPCPEIISMTFSVPSLTTTTTVACDCETGYTMLPDESGCVKEEETAPTIINSGFCFAPSILAGQYSSSGTKVYQPGYSSNLVGAYTALGTSYWKEAIAGVTGPMNRESVWVDTDCNGTKDALTSGQVLQFTYPVVLSVPTTLYIGVGGDNTFRVSINGTSIVYCDTTLSGSAGGIGATANFNFWHVFPVDFPAGTTYVTFAGVGDGSTNDSFAAVIYNSTEPQLFGATQDADLNILFQTSDLRGSTLDIATCSSGWFLDTSGGSGNYVCKRLEYLGCGESTTTTTTSA